MWKLLGIFAVSMLFAIAAEAHSSCKARTIGYSEYFRKDKLFIFIMAACMAIFVGLRVSYNDTPTYRHVYETIDITGGIFKEIDWSLGENPGFNVLNRILKYLGFSTQSFLMFYAILTNGIYIWFIRKYTSSIWLSVFYFFTMGCYTFTMAAIKQCTAVAFCLLSVDSMLEKKWYAFIFWVLFACTFHPYAIMYIVTPLLLFKPWTSNTWKMFGLFGLAGILLQSMLGTIISLTTMLGEEYSVSSFTGGGVSLFRLAVIWSPTLLSFLGKRQLSRNSDEKANLIINLSMLNAEIMFVALFGTANYFARLANYFLIFQTMALPYLFKYFNTKSKQMLCAMTVICYLLYFYYANAITQSFDFMFPQMNFFTYLQSLFV